eukprot:sb/3477412/
MTQPRLSNPATVSLVVIQLSSNWSCSFNIRSGEKNELLSRGLKLWIPRMSTHTNIVTKYQRDRTYYLGDMRLGVPHVFLAQAVFPRFTGTLIYRKTSRLFLFCFIHTD